VYLLLFDIVILVHGHEQDKDLTKSWTYAMWFIFVWLGQTRHLL